MSTDTSTQIAPLPVTVEHAERWQRALSRAAEAHIEVAQAEHIRATDDENDELVVYRITSHSQPGLLHYTVTRRKHGDVSVKCSCTAGRLPTPVPCTHAAIAIETAGWWPFTILSQTQIDAFRALPEDRDGVDVDEDGDAVEPPPPARFRAGQAVKLVWQRRITWWVAAVQWDGGGWRYQLADVARTVYPAWHPEHKLRPATQKRSVAA